MFLNDDVRGLRGYRNCRNSRPSHDNIEVSPTETVVNTRTNNRVVKHVHPTEVINVNRTIIKNKHFYPVSEREVNEIIVENYDCGSDINNPRCRRVSRNDDYGCNNHHCNCRNR